MTATLDDKTDHPRRPHASTPVDTSADADRPLPDRFRHFSRTPRVVTAVVILVAMLVFTATAPVAAGLSASDSVSATEPQSPGAVTVEPTGVESSSDRPDLNGSFSRPTFTGTAGDTVEIRYSTDETRYLLIGGNRLTDTGQPVGYTDVVRLSPDSTNITINTRLLGTNVSGTGSAPESCALTSCDLAFRDKNGNTLDDVSGLSDLSGATGAGGLARPLVPQRYRLAITNGTFVVEEPGVVTPVEAAESADLLLTKPAFHDEVEVFTTADPNTGEDGDTNVTLSSLERNGRNRTAVTEGDRVVLGFESTGIWGALSYFADRQGEGPLQSGQSIDHSVLTDLLNAQEGVTLRVRQTNPSMNEPPAELNLANADPEDVMLLLADAEELEAGSSTPGRFYLILDTSKDGPFTEDPEPGDEFAVEFALEGTDGQRYAFADNNDSQPSGPPAAFTPAHDVSEQFPYWETSEGTVSARAAFSIQERYFEYDHVTDDGELLVEASGGQVTGTTTILPPIEMVATFVDDKRDEPFRSESEVQLSDDGNFSISADLGDADPGTRLNYELYDGTTLRDSRTVIVVDDTDDPDRLAIESVPENVTVAAGGNLSALGISVRNAGGLAGEGTLALAVDNGNLTAARELTLSPNESRTVGFPSAIVRLEPGKYPFTVTLDGDRRNGTVTVATNPARTTIDDDEANGSDTADAENSTDAGGNATQTDSVDATDSDENSSNPSGNSSEPSGDSGGPDDQREPTTFLPFGIGTRETLLGTVVVGAIHLLGHWV